MTRSEARAASPVTELVKAFSERRPIRSTSLIISLFGDVVTQHGGVIWLGSMVDALGQLGLDERLVRTSTFRLVKDGWLDSSKIGRRSFYRFSDQGLREYRRVAGRIYSPEPPTWDGHWTLLIPVNVPEAQRDAFRKAMKWQGFGTLAPNLYAHPGAIHSGADAALLDLGLENHVVMMNASTQALQSRLLINDLLWENWGLAELEQRYADFVAIFAPLAKHLERRQLSDADSFVLRQLLVHDYRRVLLHDTDLPAELLPRRWPGGVARTLAAQLYRQLAAGSARYIASHLESDKGLMPAPIEGFWQRFGGSSATTR